MVSSDVGTDGPNLSHFLTVNDLVKFRNFKKCFLIPKDDVSVHPSLKLQLLVTSQRGDMINFLRPIFEKDVICSILYTLSTEF